jgi:hypothetical protein
MSDTTPKRIGPMKKETVTYLCLGCEYLARDVETLRVGGGWKTINYCRHPSLEGHRRLIGENKDAAPSWCPEMNL